MFQIRLEKLNEDGSYSTRLVYLVCSFASIPSTVMLCCEAVADDHSGSYLLKVYDKRDYYRELHLDCHLDLFSLHKFLTFL